MSTSTPEQPPEGQDQQAPAAPTPAPLQDGPWASDLNALFADAATRQQVDQFLRSKVQPYTTQLEQQAAQSKDAMRLWSNLSESPVDTYVAITTEMFGEEAGKAVLNSLQNAQGSTPAQQQQAVEQQAAVDPRLSNALEWVENQQNQTYYDTELARTVAEHPDVNPDLFHPFVAAANGKFDEAYDIYQGFVSKWSQAHPVLETPPPVAPPVMGSDTAAQTTPPTVPGKQTLDEAINDFMAEQRANREAPPVA